MALPAAGFGRLLVVPLSVSPKQLTGSNTAMPNKWYAPFKGRVLGFKARAGVITGTTWPTAIAVRAVKNGTVLHSVDIALGSTTLNTTDALLSATLVALRSTIKFAVDDYLAVQVELTGGSTFTLDGTGGEFYLERD